MLSSRRTTRRHCLAIGRNFLGGLLANARAASVFSTPTLNGYKRYHGINSMAPIQAVWAQDNRGVMIRVMGEPGDPSTHLENRCGEPLANPYLYMASQIYAGLDGVARTLDPGPSADAPYQISAEALPAIARRGARRRCARMPASVPGSATASSTTTRGSRRPRSRAAARMAGWTTRTSAPGSTGNISTVCERRRCLGCTMPHSGAT